jgi:ElaB/YqjD/DUF883 family membrane-anchored ribosome-binding protein
MAAHNDSLIHAAANTVADAAGSIAPTVKSATQQIGVLADQSGDFLESAKDRLREQGGDILRQVVAYTRQHPLAALAIAIGAGALLASAAHASASRR